MCPLETAFSTGALRYLKIANAVHILFIELVACEERLFAFIFSDWSGSLSAKEARQNLTQKRQPLDEQAEVVAGACEECIDLVAVAAFQEVAPEPSILFHVTDDRLDRSAAFEFALDLRRHAAFLA